MGTVLMNDDDFKRLAAQRRELKGYEMPFEQWHQLMHTPQADEFFGLTKEMAVALVESVPYANMVKLIEKISAGNDVESLMHFLDDRLVRRLQPNGPIQSPEICFAVTHMLVNGRGQNEFAAAWLQRFGGQLSTYAHKHYRSGLQQADTAKDEVVYAQRRLGLAMFCDPFGRPSESSQPAVIAVLEREIQLEEPVRTRMLRQRQYEFASILRDYVPTELPSYVNTLKGQTVKTNLAEMLWGKPALHYALDAVDLAYGTGNPRIREQMQVAIKAAVALGQFELSPKDPALWNALEKWGDREVGSALWRGKYVTILGLTAIATNYHEALLKLPGEKAIGVLGRLEAMGTDLQQFLDDNTGHTTSNKKAFRGFRRLMDFAVEQSAPHIVGWLLVNECDPELEMNQDGTWLNDNAVQAAVLKEERSKGGSKHADVVQVATLMRAHMAKKHALEAVGLIEEMQFSDARAQRPTP